MSPHDALDPGDGTYPHWPRLPDGTPDPERMPQGLRRHKDPSKLDALTRRMTGESRA